MNLKEKNFKIKFKIKQLDNYLKMRKIKKFKKQFSKIHKYYGNY